MGNTCCKPSEQATPGVENSPQLFPQLSLAAIPKKSVVGPVALASPAPTAGAVPIPGPPLSSRQMSFSGSLGGLDPSAESEALALFRLGQAYEKGEDSLPKEPARAFECFLRAAELGYSKAQMRVGYYYDVGYGCPEDPKNAVLWYSKAVSQGEPKAMFSLGLCYAKGIGVDKDEVQALQLFMQSSELGYDRATYNLGYCYEQGIGCDKSLPNAIVLYRKAAERGNVFAKQRLSLFSSTPENAEA